MFDLVKISVLHHTRSSIEYNNLLFLNRTVCDYDKGPCTYAMIDFKPDLGFPTDLGNAGNTNSGYGNTNRGYGNPNSQYGNPNSHYGNYH